VPSTMKNMTSSTRACYCVYISMATRLMEESKQKMRCRRQDGFSGVLFSATFTRKKDEPFLFWWACNLLLDQYFGRLPAVTCPSLEDGYCQHTCPEFDQWAQYKWITYKSYSTLICRFAARSEQFDCASQNIVQKGHIFFWNTWKVRKQGNIFLEIFFEINF
jgi:hypothetical protein